jgi:hypothetical protein
MAENGFLGVSLRLIFHELLKSEDRLLSSRQQKKINEHLNQPSNYKNLLVMTPFGLRIDAMAQVIDYYHGSDFNSSMMLRKSKAIVTD